jgi:hypothetical protein
MLIEREREMFTRTFFETAQHFDIVSRLNAVKLLIFYLNAKVCEI